MALRWASSANLFTKLEPAANALALKLQSLPVQSLDDFESYAPNFTDLWRRAGDYVVKILKGVTPGVQSPQPRAFEFLVNLNTAKQIGLTIPPQVLAWADRVIR